MNSPITIREKLETLGIVDANVKTLTNEEFSLVSDMKDGLKLKYKLFTWSLTGNISVTAFSDKYNSIVNRYDSFRKRYIYRGISTPQCAIVSRVSGRIPTMDISRTTSEKQELLMMNIISAESRKLYNSETDAPFSLKLFITSENTMVVLMKIYPYISMPISPFDLRRMVFENMKIDTGSSFSFDEEKAEKYNEVLSRKQVEFWHKKLNALDKPVMVPLAGPTGAADYYNYSTAKNIENNLASNVLSYLANKQLPLEVLFIREYAAILGEFNEIRKPLIGVRKKETPMQIMPILVDLDLKYKDTCDNIISQEKEFYKNSDCFFMDFIKGVGINASRYFDILFEFTNEDNVDSVVAKTIESINANEITEFDPRLTIHVLYSKKDITIKYTYASNYVSDYIIQMLHESIEKCLKEIVSPAKKFDWKAYISEYKDQEEKIAKLETAQKALYIKDAGIIKSDDANEIIRLSETGYIGNYIVEDTIFEEGQIIDSFGILVSGHIEERATDLEGLIKTVAIYKPGYVIGMESILHNKKGSFSYVAAEECRIMWFDNGVLREVLNNHIETYKILLLKMLEENEKLKKLWLIE